MEKTTKTTQIITVTSGKGGVGKTNVSVNTAINLARLGKKVCIFDADLGLANVNILLGLQPEFTLSHVVSGQKELSDIVLQSNYGIKVIPASSGIERLADLDDYDREKLLTSISSLQEDLDYLIIDTSSGISINVLSFVLAADKALVVLSPEPTSLTDAYALIKVMAVRKYDKPINIIVNMVSSGELAKKIFLKMESVVSKFLDVKLVFLGYVLLDRKLPQSVIYQKPISILDSTSKASKCFAQLAKDILEEKHESSTRSGIKIFFQNAIDILKSPVFSIKRNRISKNISINVPKEAVVHDVCSIKKLIGQKCQKKDVSENELIDLYRFVGDSYKKRFNKSICEPFDAMDKAPYTKIDELVGKMENILENEKVLAKDLNKIKNDSGKYTDELRKLVTYINHKNADKATDTVTAKNENALKGVSNINFISKNIDSADSITVPFCTDNPNNKSRYVQELNFEDL